MNLSLLMDLRKLFDLALPHTKMSMGRGGAGTRMPLSVPILGPYPIPHPHKFSRREQGVDSPRKIFFAFVFLINKYKYRNIHTNIQHISFLAGRENRWG